MPVSAMKARFQIAECSSLYQQGRTGWFACKAILTIMWCNQNEYNEQRGTTKDWLFPFVRLEAIVSGVSVISDFPINYRLAVIGGEEGLVDDANAKILAALKATKKNKKRDFVKWTKMNHFSWIFTWEAQKNLKLSFNQRLRILCTKRIVK